MSVCLFVCLSVCALAYLKNQIFKFHTIFCEYYLWPWLVPPLTTTQLSYVIYFRVADNVTFSRNDAQGYTVAQRQWPSSSDSSPPVWATSTRTHLAANDMIGWRGGWPCYGAGTKSAVFDCFVLYGVGAPLYILLTAMMMNLNLMRQADYRNFYKSSSVSLWGMGFAVPLWDAEHWHSATP